jgi:hypothetical protein
LSPNEDHARRIWLSLCERTQEGEPIWITSNLVCVVYNQRDCRVRRGKVNVQCTSATKQRLPATYGAAKSR